MGYGEGGVGLEWIVTFRVLNAYQYTVESREVVCNLGGILIWAC